MMPIATITIFNKFSNLNNYNAIRYLCQIRPNVVIPKMLEKLYPLLEDNMTERDKLGCVFSCLTSMLRPMIQGSRYFDKGIEKNCFFFSLYK